MGVLGGACDDSAPASGDDSGAGPDGCVVDTSTAAASAIAIAPGEKQQGSICPRGDRDWYVFDVPAGQNLLDVSASYPGSLTKVKLFARLYGADGTTPVADGEIDDSSPSTGTTSLSTTLRVAQPGRYYLEVGDIQDANSDARNTFLLEVGFAADPDTHEPNDSTAAAKSADTAPGFFAYRGDVDVFKTTSTDPSALLHLTLDNPASSKAEIDYKVTTADGTVLSQGVAPPAAAPLDTLRALGAPGDYFVSLGYPAAAQPDRRPEAGYHVTLATVPEPDPNEIPVRNDSPTTATCPGGGAGPCNTTFSGTKVDLPAQGGFVASLGDHDVYRIDATSGVPAVLEADLSAGQTPLQLELEYLAPHAASPCTSDTECAAINVTCTTDSDCELSHKCLNDDAYKFCPGGTKCRLCEGAGVCVPGAGSDRVCAAVQYATWDMDGGMTVDATGKNRLHTAQPIFAAGPMYVSVHDFQDKRFSLTTHYDLTLRVAPEIDPNDTPAVAAQRNNFYNPYPLQGMDLKPSKSRAKDITAAISAAGIAAGTTVTGYLSYQSDEDWYVFDHPCPGQDCGLVFAWIQPGPSAVRPVFIMRRDDMGIHESWTYTGATATTALSAPYNATFGDTGSDCHECSFASSKYSGKYYLQVRDYGSAHFDYSSGGKYTFKLKTISPPGCPTQCSELMSIGCGCYCASENKCPASPVL